MRLWHQTLINVLPRQQLLSQWRECCCIAANIAKYGSPRHGLVNKVLLYNVNDFVEYTKLVTNEMKRRGYRVNENVYDKFNQNLLEGAKHFNNHKPVENAAKLYSGWFDDEYLIECYYNLKEKYECGLVSKGDWETILCKINVTSTVDTLPKYVLC